MRFLRSLLGTWVKLRDAARREFLRDPHVILFERSSGQSGGGR
ncbi:hypothetical protein [Rhizorhapis sp.]|nr:hypothetical protein [Rhizorhapis sp.]